MSDKPSATYNIKKHISQYCYRSGCWHSNKLVDLPQTEEDFRETRSGPKTYRRIGESHEKILESIEVFQKHHEKVLNEILILNKKIDSIIEKKAS